MTTKDIEREQLKFDELKGLSFDDMPTVFQVKSLVRQIDALAKRVIQLESEVADINYRT